MGEAVGLGALPPVLPLEIGGTEPVLAAVVAAVELNFSTEDRVRWHKDLASPSLSFSAALAGCLRRPEWVKWVSTGEV